MGRSRKHHHTPKFYLQQFAEPMFGNSIKVFERDKGAWDKAPRTPKGIGWAWDLYSSVDLNGKQVDDFERFLTEEVDSPTAPAMKKAARDPDSLDLEDRKLVALFIGFAAARTRGLLEATEEQYFQKLSKEQSTGLGVVAKMWSDAIKRPITNRDVVIGGCLDAVIYSAMDWRNRILAWKWHFIRTPRHLPFVVSDWPAWGQLYGGFHMLSFPISSEVALITSDCPHVGLPGNAVSNVVEVNKQTISRATTFVVCHQDSFPGDDCLELWVKAKGG